MVRFVFLVSATFQWLCFVVHITVAPSTNNERQAGEKRKKWECGTVASYESSKQTRMLTPGHVALLLRSLSIVTIMGDHGGLLLRAKFNIVKRVEKHQNISWEHPIALCHRCEWQPIGNIISKISSYYLKRLEAKWKIKWMRQIWVLPCTNI